jgi:IS4 transposase
MVLSGTDRQFSDRSLGRVNKVETILFILRGPEKLKDQIIVQKSFYD